jgi:resuscitation-promoting factor RpfB
VHRSLKFSLYGLVLAGLVGGTAAWVGGGKTIDLRVDGRDQRVHTSATDVRGVLAAAHISVGEHDLVAPELASSVSNGAEIVVRRGHLLHLKVNGHSKDVWVNADSVSEALSQLGFSNDEFVSVSRSQRLDSGATDVSIDSPKRVTFVVDGRRIRVLSAGPSVFQAIDDAGLYLGPLDRLSSTGKITDGQVIKIQRVRYARSVSTQTVPFKTVEQKDPSNYIGTNTVVRQGKNGSSTVTYRLIYVDGKYSGRVVLSSVPVNDPVDQITKVGSKPAQVAAVVPAGTAQKIAATMVKARGWGTDQFSCLVSLWSKESGWRTNASNPSGAYGIPQALPGSKMASAGADWETNAATQITWGLSYIAGVYGTPCAAWAHSQATNWY